jgi:hypothetical protein
MANMYSIGELIDKLVIENIKIFKLRETLHQKDIDNKEFVDNGIKMNIINENRGVIINFLNKKIEDVANGEINSYFKDVKTYNNENKNTKKS